VQLNNKNYSLLIFPIISFIGGIWQGQYTDDGYHWGFIFSNALDIINGKIPFKEIFIEYGIFSTIIHSITLLVFEKNLISLIIITSLLYSLSIFLIGSITEKFTLNKYLGFLSTFVIFMIYPWPVSPWPNFISFFFIILFSYFYIIEGKKFNYLSGVSLGLAYLSYTTVYNFIITFFLILCLIFIVLNFNRVDKNFIKKNINCISAFIATIAIFLIYLIYNNLLVVWMNYQKIPFIMANAYDVTVLEKINDYIYFIFVYSFKNFIYEPQILVYTLIFISNIYLICKIIYSYKKLTITDLNLLIINFLILSLNIYAQLSDIDKLGTSLSLGIVSLLLVINAIKLNENKIIVNFIVIFISLYSFTFAFGLENSKFGGSREAYYKNLKNREFSYKDESISYFKSQKWNENSWHILNSFKSIQEKINHKCSLEYGVNLTSNAFLYVLMDYKKIQVIPFFYKAHNGAFRNNFDKNFIRNIQNEINKNNILVISNKNNDKIVNLINYAQPTKINMKINTDNFKSYLYVYYPKKCENFNY
tara:strand:+ start:1020 stop:2618 length:1599 start_codon:yes stop_codon:yes gene_type:complete